MITKETDVIQSVADVGAGSVLFNDSDDYLTLSNTSDLKFGTSDFTIECFVKPETLNTNAYSSYFSTILDFDGGTGNYAGAGLQFTRIIPKYFGQVIMPIN